jgi:hypothetical protein
MEFGMNFGLQHKHYTSVLKRLHPSPITAVAIQFSIDSFLIASRQKNGPLGVRLAPIHHGRLTNHVLTVPMIERLLCSLVDESDQTKLGIHS